MKTYCSDGEGNQVKIWDLEKRTREQKEESKARRARDRAKRKARKRGSIGIWTRGWQMAARKRTRIRSRTMKSAQTRVTVMKRRRIRRGTWQDRQWKTVMRYKSETEGTRCLGCVDQNGSRPSSAILRRVRCEMAITSLKLSFKVK
jgi:hypothetical protein